MEKPMYRREVVCRWEKVSVMCVWPESDEVEPDEMRQLYRKYAVLPQQTHSVNAGIVTGKEDEFPDTDALISLNSQIAVGVVTADCVPIVIYCDDIEAVAAVHAGWRGTLGGIVENVFGELERRGAKPENMHVAIGPAIHKENYEVDRDLAERFAQAGFDSFVSWPGGNEARPHLDLPGINEERLLRRGVKRENILVHPACTFGNISGDGHRYPSHRRSGGAPARLMTYIGKSAD